MIEFMQQNAAAFIIFNIIVLSGMLVYLISSVEEKVPSITPEDIVAAMYKRRKQLEDDVNLNMIEDGDD